MKTREIQPPGHKETRKFRTALVLYHKQNQEMMDSMKHVTTDELTLQTAVKGSHKNRESEK